MGKRSVISPFNFKVFSTRSGQENTEDEIMLSPWEGIVIETRGGVPLRMYKDRPRSLGQVLEETVRRVPRKEAIVCESTRWSYQELNHRVNALAASLAGKLGIQKGDRVSLLQISSRSSISAASHCLRSLHTPSFLPCRGPIHFILLARRQSD